MEKRTRKVDAKARTTLFNDFAGCLVTVERVSHDEVRIRKMKTGPRKYSLAQLVAGITKENRHGEVRTGRSVGGEAW